MAKENIFRQTIETGEALLKGYKNKMRKEAYNILQADFYSSVWIRQIQQFEYAARLGLVKDEYFKMANTLRNLISNREKSLSPESKNISVTYPIFALNLAGIGKGKGGNSLRFKDKFIPDIYKELMDVYKGELRDRVLVFFALNILNRKAGQGIFNDIISNIETSYYREVLDIHGDNNLVGKPAYNFSLEDTSGRLVKMEEFMGKVAFVDFWFTGCAGCNQYYDKVLAKVEEHFKGNSNVIFVAISIDTDKKRWMEGIRSGKYTSPEVVNLYTNGKGEAHPVIENYRVLSYPRPVLIDRNGNIFSNNNDELRSGGAEKLIETIDKALEKNQVDHGNMN
ncbi:MAG TPA: TlpA disulfide reductase family protein [Chitinophagaceae bacterium]|nr:TlpA disulfide reductase family protein [Chitinophagaceae bacterium]